MRLRRDERGSVAAEFAVVVPAAMLLVLLEPRFFAAAWGANPNSLILGDAGFQAKLGGLR